MTHHGCSVSHTVQRSTGQSSLSSWLAATQADQYACRLATDTVRILLPLAKVSSAVLGRELWRDAGYSSVHDFAAEQLERSGRWLRDHAALHRAVERFPALRNAVSGEDGSAPIGLCKALLVGRIATSETLALWIERARRLTVAQLQQAVRQQETSSGEYPPTPMPLDGEAAAGDAGRDSRCAEPVSVCDHDINDMVRVLWSIPAPPAVRAAFDSALDLYRRLEGGEATTTSFIEALVAEELASGRPPDVSQTRLRLVEPLSNPGFTPSGFEIPALSVARETLEQLDAAMARAGEGASLELLAQLEWLANAVNEMERNLAALLVDMSSSGALRELGFASIGAYAEDRLGLARTTIEDRVRAARSLAKRPAVHSAYAKGEVGLEKVLLATQILGSGFVDPAREAAWVEHLEQCTVKRLRDEKRALLWASAVEGCSEPPMPMSDEAWFASLRCAPGDTVAAVQRAGHAACNDTVLVPLVGNALRLRLPVELASDFTACVESRRRLLSADADRCDWSQPFREEDPASWRAARTFSTASRRLPAWVGLLAILEEFCATYDVADKRSASQSEVFVRAGHRCEAPGCTSRRVEWHHRHYRSRGGSNHHDNGDALCPTHHRHGQHGGHMQVGGDTPLQRTWRLGPVGSGKWYRNERRLR